jgi:HPr kinase/phosphorylase
MIPLLTVRELYTAQRTALRLEWVNEPVGGARPLEPTTARFPGMALVGHLNYVHPNRVQVLGENERRYLERLDAATRRRALDDLFGNQATVAVIVAEGGPAPGTLEAAAEGRDTALFSTPFPSPIVIDHLQFYLTRALAPRVTVHGVYMEVMGMGVLITGEPGIGKSELALELLSRNHRQIADDAVELVRVGPDVLVGQCPGALSDYLEVRGLGILDVRLMFGETAVRHKKRLHLIVQLEQMKSSQWHKLDRLRALERTRTILDVAVPEVVLFVGPGRNLAVLVEAATRAYILRMWGINPVEQFLERHQALIDESAARGARTADKDPLPLPAPGGQATTGGGRRRAAAARKRSKGRR